MRVLMTAYGCRPEAASEAFQGWTWVASMSQVDCVALTVVTPASNREAIEAASPLAAEFVYVDDEFRVPRVLPGELHDAVAYVAYSRRADRAVRALGPRFDVAHHVSWTNIRTASPAFAAGCPVIFGPVGGGQLFPWALRSAVRPSAAAVEGLRNLQVLSTRWAHRARSQLRTASVVVAANRETERFARANGAQRVEMMGDLPSLAFLQDCASVEPTRAAGDNELRLVWVGRLLPRKGVGLAVEAVRRASEEVDVRLTIVGDGPDRSLLDGLDPRVFEVLGRVPRSELDHVYRRSDGLLYTSLRDTGGPPLAEAMSFGLPAVIIDHQGPALLGEGWSLGVPPGRSVEDLTARLAARIVELAGDHEVRQRLSTAALAKAQDSSIENRRSTALGWYQAASPQLER